MYQLDSRKKEPKNNGLNNIDISFKKKAVWGL